MTLDSCRRCLPDEDYADSMLSLTETRRRCLENAAALVVLSRYMAEELDAVGLPGAQVIPPWIEVNESAPQPGSGFLLGGRLVRYKGLDLAIEAWKRSSSNHPLRVAGEGPLEKDLDDIERLGWLSNDALRQRLHHSRALLFPSLWQEPFGILGVESLAESTPVIAIRSGGVEDWAEEGTFLIDGGDVASMTEAIDALSSDVELAMELGAKGRELVRRRFSKTRIQPRLEALYASVRP